MGQKLRLDYKQIKRDEKLLERKFTRSYQVRESRRSSLFPTDPVLLRQVLLRAREY
jgi:hypothetical protein